MRTNPIIYKFVKSTVSFLKHKPTIILQNSRIRWLLRLNMRSQIQQRKPIGTGAVYREAYVSLDGEEVRKGVTVCDRGRSQEHFDLTLLIFLPYAWSSKLKVIFNFLL